MNALALSAPAARTRRGLLAFALAAIAGFLLLAPGVAQADNSSTLTVVGTSDVQDSGLMPLLIKPLFQKAYPGVTLNYVSKGTGAAISYAEAGTASALLVHAASLENQFVAQGYSAEPYGRAIFYGDFVLLGPASDPAGVLSGSPHDIVGAFEKIAAAGATGKADFVSRGDTSGTVVEEHNIWALASGDKSITQCPVSAKNGGGSAPSSTTTCGTSPSYPSWYHSTGGLTQGPNVENANTCNYSNASSSGHNDCYVLTDRGTFDCLTDATCAGVSGSAAPTNLQIVGRDNASTAPGGQTLLVNSFHAYAINAKKFAGDANVQINSTAATDFLSFLTSQSFQAQLKNFLVSGKDKAPFSADASPSITASKFPANVTAGKKITISGTVSNLVPGTPPLAGKTVTVSQVLSALPAGIPIASTRTTATGGYKLSFTVPATGSYQVQTGQIQQIENSTLNPAFGDILQPGATAASRVSVKSRIDKLSEQGIPGGVLVRGSVLPGSLHVRASVALLARKNNKGKFKQVASTRLSASDRNFALLHGLPKGKWGVEIRFQDPGQVTASTSKATMIHAGPRAAVVLSTRSIKVSRGHVTVQATIRGVTGSGVKAQLLGLDLGNVVNGQRAITRTSADVFKRKVGLTVRRAGTTTFTLHFQLKRGQRWALVLQSIRGRSTLAYGGVKTVRVS